MKFAGEAILPGYFHLEDVLIKDSIPLLDIEIDRISIFSWVAFESLCFSKHWSI